MSTYFHDLIRSSANMIKKYQPSTCKRSWTECLITRTSPFFYVANYENDYALNEFTIIKDNYREQENDKIFGTPSLHKILKLSIAW